MSTSDVQKLRQETGAGIMDCKKAIDESAGDFDKAREILAQRGLDKAASTAASSSGLLGSVLMGSTIRWHRLQDIPL